jgi:hypothetical protein
MVVELSALHHSHSLPPGRFLVLISDRGWVDHGAIARMAELGELKNPVTSLRTELLTFQPVTYSLNKSHNDNIQY